MNTNTNMTQIIGRITRMMQHSQFTIPTYRNANYNFQDIAGCMECGVSIEDYYLNTEAISGLNNIENMEEVD